RALGYACLLLAWALSAGCLSEPKAEDWLAVGFRTPEQTFRTFQTGLRADLPDLEYRCFGADFKHRVGGSLLAYVGRLRPQPLLKYAAKAKIKKVQELSPERVRIEAEVNVWFHHRSFTVDFVREDFYELYEGEKRVDDDLADWDRIVRQRNDELVVTVPLH